MPNGRIAAVRDIYSLLDPYTLVRRGTKLQEYLNAMISVSKYAYWHHSSQGDYSLLDPYTSVPKGTELKNLSMQ